MTAGPAEPAHYYNERISGIMVRGGEARRGVTFQVPPGIPKEGRRRWESIRGVRVSLP